MGLGFATLIPEDGNVSMETADVPGIKLSGMIFDAGPRNSPALLVVGGHGGFGHGGWTGSVSEPTLVQDVFFRIGGAEAGRATTSLIVNTDAHDPRRRVVVARGSRCGTRRLDASTLRTPA